MDHMVPRKNTREVERVQLEGEEGRIYRDSKPGDRSGYICGFETDVQITSMEMINIWANYAQCEQA